MTRVPVDVRVPPRRPGDGDADRGSMCHSEGPVRAMQIVGRLVAALAAVVAGCVVVEAPPAAAAVPSDIVSGVAAAACGACTRTKPAVTAASAVTSRSMFRIALTRRAL